MDVVESLAISPSVAAIRGIARSGIKEFRQTFFKPYRVIYRVTGKGGHHSFDHRRAPRHAIATGSAVHWRLSREYTARARPG